MQWSCSLSDYHLCRGRLSTSVSLMLVSVGNSNVNRFNYQFSRFHLFRISLSPTVSLFGTLTVFCYFRESEVKVVESLF